MFRFWGGGEELDGMWLYKDESRGSWMTNAMGWNAKHRGFEPFLSYPSSAFRQERC